MEQAKEKLEIIEHTTLAEALLHAQFEYPPLEKNKTVKVTTLKGANYSYDYADLAHTKKMTDPSLWKHGLVINGRTEFRDGKEFQVDVLRHIHSKEEDKSEIEITEGDMKQLGGNSTYAKRYNYCNLTGRVGEDDSEPRPSGDRGRDGSQERHNAPDKPDGDRKPPVGSGSAGKGMSADDEAKFKRLKDRLKEAEETASAQGITDDEMNKLADDLIGPGKEGIELYNSMKVYGVALKALTEEKAGDDNPNSPEHLEDNVRGEEGNE